MLNGVMKQFWLPGLVFVAFLLLNFSSSGPAYMSDEIGYLSKAATLAGEQVNHVTSWFGGYSYLISPAFMLTSDPVMTWKLLLVLNAAMWGMTAWLLGYVLRKLRPEATDKAVLLATGGAMLYPSWLSMSGYAFATSGFVLVLMASLAALLKSDVTDWRWLAVSSLLAAFLGWMHPLGFIYVALMALLIIGRALTAKKPQLAGIGILGLVAAVIYPTAIQPMFTRAMQGGATNESHYSDSAATITQAIGTTEYWLNAGLLVIGLLFFVVVATFGIILFAIAPAVKQALDARRRPAELLGDARLMVSVLPFLAILGVVAVTAASWAATDYIRIDQWVYGRYSDMYLLPLIGLGLMVRWSPKLALAAAGFAGIAGLVLTAATNPENTAFMFNNKVNLQSLWPMHFGSVIHANHYWFWGLLGAVGIGFVGVLGSYRRQTVMALLLVPVAMCGIANSLYHQTIVKQYSTPAELYTVIKQKYQPDDCIGFTTDVDSQERFNLYTYYLRGYDFKKMTVQEWQAEGCTGPYLTYDNTVAHDGTMQLLGPASDKGLFAYIPMTDVPSPIAKK